MVSNMASGKTVEKENITETELSVLKEILVWTKISGMQQVKTILTGTLDEELKKTLYQLSDGAHSTRELILKYKLQTSRATIQKWWKQWGMLGIGEQISVRGGGQRFVRSFDLDAFGIFYQIPEIDNVKSDTESPKNYGSQEKLSELEED